MNAVQTKLDKVRQQCLKEKAAKMWGCDIKKIKSVVENNLGTAIQFKNGEIRIIPMGFWIGEEVEAR